MTSGVDYYTAFDERTTDPFNRLNSRVVVVLDSLTLRPYYTGSFNTNQRLFLSLVLPICQFRNSKWSIWLYYPKNHIFAAVTKLYKNVRHRNKSKKDYC